MPWISKQAIGGMALEVIPDLLDGIEFRSIAGEWFDMKTRMGPSQLSNEGPLVDATIVPQQDDRPPQVAQKQAKEGGDICGAEVP